MLITEPMRADERTFRQHIKNPNFRLGEFIGKWRIMSQKFPSVIISIAAAKRENAPSEYNFLFDLNNYPQDLPTAQPWDVTVNSTLAPDKWPGGLPGSRVAFAFNPGWNQTALYLPCDRLALPGHEGWQSSHPHLIWNSSKDLSFYLEVIYDLLNSSGYTGLRTA